MDNEITTDNFVQASTNTSNWEPGGAHFQEVLQEARPSGTVQNRSGSLTIVRTYSKKTGNILVQRATISGTYGYDVNFGDNGNAEGVSADITGSSSARLDSVDRNVTVDLNWSGNLTYPVDTYSYNITGTTTATYILTPEESEPITPPVDRSPTIPSPVLPQNPTLISPQLPVRDAMYNLPLDNSSIQESNPHEMIGHSNFIPDFVPDMIVDIEDMLIEENVVETYDKAPASQQKLQIVRSSATRHSQNYNAPSDMNDLKGAPSEVSAPFEGVIPFVDSDNVDRETESGTKKYKEELPIENNNEFAPSNSLKQKEFLKEDSSKVNGGSNMVPATEGARVVTRTQKSILSANNVRSMTVLRNRVVASTIKFGGGNKFVSDNSFSGTYSNNVSNIATASSPIAVASSAPYYISR